MTKMKRLGPMAAMPIAPMPGAEVKSAMSGFLQRLQSAFQDEVKLSLATTGRAD